MIKSKKEYQDYLPANAVVNKSFLYPNITIEGVPAKKINDKGSEVFIVQK